MTTNSEVINFNPEFYNFFTILGGEINANINNNDNISNIDDYAIYVDPDSIIKMEEQDYDSMFNTCIPDGKFAVRNITNPDEPEIPIVLEGEKEIFISELALQSIKKNNGYIYFKDLDDDVKLFETIIMNQELTKSLYDLNKKSDPWGRNLFNCWNISQETISSEASL